MMRCALECKVKVPDVSTVTLKSTLSSGEIFGSIFLINLNPIIVDGTKVSFNKDVMEMGKWYPFSYKNENYLAVKTSDTVIDIYKVKK